MKQITSFILNTVFFSIIILIAFSVATIALTKKINEERKNFKKNIDASVVKDEIPVLATTQGVIVKNHFRVGEEVKRNDLLVEVENPVLQGKIAALEEFPDNISAQTEARVAKEEMKGLLLYSPVNGVVTEISVTEGAPVQTLTKIMTVYSNDNIRLLADLSPEQYQIVQQMGEISAYSERLNQNFAIKPDILRPDETVKNFDEKKIGLYFIFKNSAEAKSLLQNEDLELNLKQNSEPIFKPVDIFVNFWNQVVFKQRT